MVISLSPPRSLHLVLTLTFLCSSFVSAPSLPSLRRTHSSRFLLLRQPNLPHQHHLPPCRSKVPRSSSSHARSEGTRSSSSSSSATQRWSTRKHLVRDLGQVELLGGRVWRCRVHSSSWSHLEETRFDGGGLLVHEHECGGLVGRLQQRPRNRGGFDDVCSLGQDGVHRSGGWSVDVEVQGRGVYLSIEG